MASSTEEVSGPNDLSGGSRREDATQDQFGVFKDFDFLEYESESVEVRRVARSWSGSGTPGSGFLSCPFSSQGESTDNFNWGVRRRPLLEGKTDQDVISSAHEESVSEDTPVLEKKKVGDIGNSVDVSRSHHVLYVFPILHREESLRNHPMTKLVRSLHSTKYPSLLNSLLLSHRTSFIRHLLSI